MCVRVCVRVCVCVPVPARTHRSRRPPRPPPDPSPRPGRGVASSAGGPRSGRRGGRRPAGRGGSPPPPQPRERRRDGVRKQAWFTLDAQCVTVLHEATPGDERANPSRLDNEASLRNSAYLFFPVLFAVVVVVHLHILIYNTQERRCQSEVRRGSTQILANSSDTCVSLFFAALVVNLPPPLVWCGRSVLTSWCGSQKYLQRGHYCP